MTFHWYGFIVGLALVIVLWGVEYLFQRSKSAHKIFLPNGQLIGLLVLIVIGARLWHVATDWHRYGQFSWQLLAVWQGGLSILGAIVAGMLGIWWLVPNQSQRRWFIDALVLWLPIGQAVGRCANWINQELYGLPTSLPWGIYISRNHRLPGFEGASFFHPLFLYEAVGLLLLASLLWYLFIKKTWQLGGGKLSMLYLAGYVWLRYWLDFLRIDRGREWYGLGTNQWVLVLVGLSWLGWFVFQNRQRRLSWKWLMGIGMLLVVNIAGSVMLGSARQEWLKSPVQTNWISGQSISSHLLKVPDQSVQTFFRHDAELQLVVVTTDASRQQGLSGTHQVPEQGMLFVFDKPAKYVFWMKDMQYPLDFIWFRDGKVVDLHTQVSSPSADITDAQLPRYVPREPVDMMLEVTAGTVRTDSWQIGDTLQLAIE